MGQKLLQAIYMLDRVERSAHRRTPLNAINPRAKVVVTLAYIVVMLSMPTERLATLILFGIYPALTASMGGIGYGSLVKCSVWIVPLLAVIALPNILLRRESLFFVGDIAITEGWISAIAIVLRGLYSVQATMILIFSTGLYRLCHALQGLGLPSMMASQIYLTMRYLRLILEEALALQRARTARGFGRSNYPIKMWAVLIVQLLLGSLRRAEHIGQCMASRGFEGAMPSVALHNAERWRWHDTLYSVAWCGLLLLVRTLHLAEGPL